MAALDRCHCTWISIFIFLVKANCIFRLVLIERLSLMLICFDF